MNSNYVAEIQSTCIPNEQLVAGQHVSVNIIICIRIQVVPADNMLVKRGLTPGTAVQL